MNGLKQFKHAIEDFINSQEKLYINLLFCILI